MRELQRLLLILGTVCMIKLCITFHTHSFAPNWQDWEVKFFLTALAIWVACSLLSQLKIGAKVKFNARCGFVALISGIIVAVIFFSSTSLPLFQPPETTTDILVFMFWILFWLTASSIPLLRE